MNRLLGTLELGKTSDVFVCKPSIKRILSFYGFKTNVIVKYYKIHRAGQLAYYTLLIGVRTVLNFTRNIFFIRCLVAQ